ncbi:SIMPL domain-containing protein [Paenibacillus mendelii]|uniref:SIMPL domain-containing protein n=1 Tax=Paenibacillus mendelii TaxID=206163 RepID=A0ABV6J4V8_9BACL|nr:SIMPL domain-containing protein [Paenibacillus mendelii]MCQ6564118.1 SIMPL domain-containing protein [Paenibacillus mendelii]
MYYSHPLTSPAMTAAPLSHYNRLITVTGEGKVSTAPKRAIIVLGVITESPSLATAQSENASAVTNVINALLSLNIPREQIQTVTYRIEIQYNYEDGTQILRGYRVTHLLQITIDRVEQTGLVVDTAVNSGANFVSSIRFTVPNLEIYYNQALSTAIQNAESKANTIARTLGVTLIRTPVKITEETQVIEPPIPFQASLLTEGAAVPTPIQPGELEIRAVLRAQYTYF